MANQSPAWAVPNRLSLGRAHPVKCALPECITILSIYNGSANDLCWTHEPKLGTRKMQDLARSLERL